MIGEFVQTVIDLVAVLSVFALVAYFVFGGRFHFTIRDGRLKVYLMIKGPGKVVKRHKSTGSLSTDEKM